LCIPLKEGMGGGGMKAGPKTGWRQGDFTDNCNVQPKYVCQLMWVSFSVHVFVSHMAFLPALWLCRKNKHNFAIPSTIQWTYLHVYRISNSFEWVPGFLAQLPAIYPATARGNPGRVAKLVLTLCKEPFNFERGLNKSVRCLYMGISSTFVRSLKFKMKVC
jgi:hypothetical protein